MKTEEILENANQKLIETAALLDDIELRQHRLIEHLHTLLHHVRQLEGESRVWQFRAVEMEKERDQWKAQAELIDRTELVDRLYHWLEDDRDRRSLVLRADHCEIWWASLRIDEKSISGRSGNDLPEVLSEVLAGMIINEPEGEESEL